MRRARRVRKRIKAAVVLAGPYDVLDFWDNMPELTRERSACAATEDGGGGEEARRTLSLQGVADKITCPLIIVTGKLDRVIRCRIPSASPARQGPVDLMIIEDATTSPTTAATNGASRPPMDGRETRVTRCARAGTTSSTHEKTRRGGTTAASPTSALTRPW